MTLQALRQVALGSLAAAGLLSVVGWTMETASAQDYPRYRRNSDEYAYLPPRKPIAADMQAVTPVFAVVSLNEQRISVYGANGRIVQSPVSSGATGYDTPAGVFSIVQKKPQHNSNLYDDASMPFMQRLTWTGIALHAGVIPGYPASHGCVRLPHAFAEKLFDMTKLGMRVILTRDDIVPEDFSHPALFKPGSLTASVEPMRISRASYRAELPISRLGNLAFENVLTPSPTAEKHLGMLGSMAQERKRDQERAQRAFLEARAIAQRRAAEASNAVRTIKAAELNVARAEDGLKAATKAVETISANPKAKPEQITAAETAKDKAAARIPEARAQLEAAKTQNQTRIEAADRAADELKAAELAKDRADELAVESERKLSPVSVFVSRKMQRFYVRQANLPVMEGPADIANPNDTIGSFVYTALDYKDASAQEMRWSVVSLYKSLGDMPRSAAPDVKPNDKPPAQRRQTRGEAVPADVKGATAALDRIKLPEDAKQRIAELMVPGSSLIISDEVPSIETGKDTDFVVVMSNEPQGALKMRAPQPKKDKYRDDDGGSTWGSWWN
jgi:hypothetical protein